VSNKKTQEELFAGIDDEWRTVPTDLGGWSNRASAMFYLAKRYAKALEEIANADYRGNRPTESEIAEKALR
jgi:hypothetical protein